MKNKVQLITYPDSFGGNLKALNKLLQKYFLDIFEGGIHILPPFPSSGDRGFAPTTYDAIEPSFGSWQDITEISQNFDVMVDVMINHISRHSKFFQDFLQHGRGSKYADMFITLDKIWPDGDPPQGDINKIFLRKPEHPFLDIQIQDTGKTERIWASFGPRVDFSEQMDLDVQAKVTQNFFVNLFELMSKRGVKYIRIDAVGYVIKKPGTSCFMVEPDVFDFLEWLTETADKIGLELLPEVHDHYTTQFRLAERGYWVYDFVLPMLVLHTLTRQNSVKLKNYLKMCPRKQITMLDCHDGIPVQPDMDDILTQAESMRIVDLCLERGANLNRILSEQNTSKDFDAHQINITYYEALGRDDDAYLAARAIQFFSPGVPQVYYVGLLAGVNDQERVKQTGEGREVNRHNFTIDEVEADLKKAVVQRLLKLIRFRNTHPGFDGEMTILECGDQQIALEWQKDSDICRLDVDVSTCQSHITYTNQTGDWKTFQL